MIKTILFSITSLHRGGAERWCVDLALQLQQRGYTISVVATYDGPMGDILRTHNIPVHIVRGFWCRYDTIWWVRYFRIVRRTKPHIIISALWIGNAAARVAGLFLRIPVITTIHAQPEHEGKARRALEQILKYLPATPVAVSSQLAHHLVAARYVRKNPLVIHNGIDTQRIVPKALYCSSNPFTVLAVGRLVPVKRFDLVIDAVALLVQQNISIRLSIVGDGPSQQDLIDRVHAQNIADHVEFLGNCDAAPVYAQADCIVRTSDSEGFSLVLMEALCAGLSAIVTDAPGCPALIEHNKTGIIVPHNDTHALAHAICILQHDEHLRARLGTAGRTLCLERYTIEQMATQYDALINSR